MTPQNHPSPSLYYFGGANFYRLYLLTNLPTSFSVELARGMHQKIEGQNILSILFPDSRHVFDNGPVPSRLKKLLLARPTASTVSKSPWALVTHTFLSLSQWFPAVASFLGPLSLIHSCSPDQDFISRSINKVSSLETSGIYFVSCHDFV